MTLLDDFLVRAMLAGLAVSLAAAPLGCFVVWRRMAYFGDATAHAAILGVALALAADVPVVIGVLLVSIAAATLVTQLSGRGFAMDTLLGVMAHSSLAVGLVAVSFLDGVRIDLMGFLFGDILAVDRTDLAVIWGGAFGVLALLWWRWDALLAATVSPELASASGIRPEREQLVLSITLAIVVAVAIKIVGVILIAALLVIPAAAARPLSNTPEGMARAAAALAALSALSGLQMSFFADTPAGPSIVTMAFAVFLLSLGIAAAVKSREP